MDGAPGPRARGPVPPVPEDAPAAEVLASQATAAALRSFLSVDDDDDEDASVVGAVPAVVEESTAHLPTAAQIALWHTDHPLSLELWRGILSIPHLSVRADCISKVQGRARSWLKKSMHMQSRDHAEAKVLLECLGVADIQGMAMVDVLLNRLWVLGYTPAKQRTEADAILAGEKLPSKFKDAAKELRKQTKAALKAPPPPRGSSGSGPPRRSGGSGRGGRGGCWTCGSPAHRQSECPDTSAPPRAGRSRSRGSAGRCRGGGEEATA